MKRVFKILMMLSLAVLLIFVFGAPATFASECDGGSCGSPPPSGGGGGGGPIPCFGWGSLSGNVTDGTNPISGVKVVAPDYNGLPLATTYTDANGNYSFDGLGFNSPAQKIIMMPTLNGLFSFIKFTKDGYADKTVYNVPIYCCQATYPSCVYPSTCSCVMVAE